LSLGISLKADGFPEEFQELMMQRVRSAVLKTVQETLDGMPKEGIQVEVLIQLGNDT